MSFEDRTLRHDITPEFITHIDAPDDHVVSQLRGEAKRIEDTYSVVTTVQKKEKAYERTGYEIVAIPKRDSDTEQIMRAIQEASNEVLRHFIE